MYVLILIGAFLLAASVTFTTNWLALIPWRRSRDNHWSEQARLLWPVLRAARTNLLTIPGVNILTVLLFWPNTSPLWLFTGIVSILGVYAGNFFLDREVFPRISSRALLRQIAIGCLMGFVVWFVLLGAAVAMPNEMNLAAWSIASGVVLFLVFWSGGGLVWVGRRIGLFEPAPERLRRIATECSTRMNISFREVLLMRVPLAQAFAMPFDRRLLFTERLLELLSDDEIAAICAHELAHLTESKAALYARSMRFLIFLPWVFFNPLIHTFGDTAFFGLLASTVLIPYIYRRISRRLEGRADAMAKANERDAGTYARALLRLYADNLAPAVTSKETTHPHLYDRLLSAGVTPDFPRPKPARSIAWHGVIFSALLGFLFAIFATRLIQAIR